MAATTAYLAAEVSPAIMIIACTMHNYQVLLLLDSCVLFCPDVLDHELACHEELVAQLRAPPVQRHNNEAMCLVAGGNARGGPALHFAATALRWHYTVLPLPAKAHDSLA